MNIAIDGFEASAKERVGVGRLEVELLKKIENIDRQNNYTIYTPHIPSSDMPVFRDGWHYAIPRFNRLWSQFAIPYSLYLHYPRPDVFFAPVHYAPRFCPIKIVLGIMDLAFLHFPDLFRKRDLYKLQHWTRYSIKKAEKIITISKSTKNDILKMYAVDHDKIHIVYPGITTLLNPHMASKYDMATIESIKKKYAITHDYLLYVGTLQPRKNLKKLIDAYIEVNKQLTQEKKNVFQLVIVGKKGWMYDEIFDYVKTLHLEKDIIFTGYVTDEELLLLYQHAACFCLVSIYEGFGFPVLEAMRAGVPVVVSNISSLPELVGEYGELVNPNSQKDISKGILNVLRMSDELRAKRIKLAQKFSETFTWERAAKQTIEIIETVGNQHN